jgi:predicted GTPase
MLKAKVPVVAVSAVRTGCGKSQTARWIARRLHAKRLRVAVIRHPMPYGNLEAAAVQRFSSSDDLDAHRCTIEEREEYEPHIAAGSIVYAGVDYGRIVKRASSEADLILWDGGNNDFPFIHPDLHIVLVDPLRPGEEVTYHPGETVLRMADIVVIAKSDAASSENIERATQAVRLANPRARVIRARSPVTLDEPDAVRGKRVIVIEDGPTTTHGGMAYGAGYIAARNAGAREIVDPRPFASAEIAAVYRAYPHIGHVLPAVGYSSVQVRALRDTIERSDVDAVIVATPIDLAHLVKLGRPIVRARYEFAEAEQPGLGEAIDTFLETSGLAVPIKDCPGVMRPLRTHPTSI